MPDLSNAMPTWRELCSRAFAGPLTFLPPAEPAVLAAIESALNVSFPAELRESLAESNGVKDEYNCWLLWPVELIHTENLAFRTEAHFANLYMPFNHLLFFAEDGCGNYYGLPVCVAGSVRRPDVFLWSHEDDSRTCLAASLRVWLSWMAVPPNRPQV